MASTRIIARVVVVVLSTLTLSAGSASAERAWVLSSRISKTVAIPKGLPGEGALRTFRRWSIVKAEETKGDCEATAKVVLGSRYGDEEIGPRMLGPDREAHGIAAR